jgi:hypothetical protein
VRVSREDVADETMKRLVGRTISVRVNWEQLQATLVPPSVDRPAVTAAADLSKLGLEMIGIRMIQIESDRPKVIIGIDDPKNLRP